MPLKQSRSSVKSFIKAMHFVVSSKNIMPVPKSNRNANSTRSCRSKTAIWTDLPYKGELQASMLKAIVKKDNKMIMQKTLKSSRNAEWVQCISYKNLAMRLYGLAG